MANKPLEHPALKDDDGNPRVVHVPPSTAKVLKTRGWLDHKPKSSTKKSTKSSS